MVAAAAAPAVITALSSAAAASAAAAAPLSAGAAATLLAAPLFTAGSAAAAAVPAGAAAAALGVAAPTAAGGLSLGTILAGIGAGGTITGGLLARQEAQEAAQRAREEESRVREDRRQRRFQTGRQEIGLAEVVRGAAGGGVIGNIAEGAIAAAGDVGVDIGVIDQDFRGRIEAINAQLRNASSLARLGSDAFSAGIGGFLAGRRLQRLSPLSRFFG